MRRPLHPASADEGITLIELMVAAFLSTLLLVAISSMFIVVAKQTVASQGARLSTADASNIMNVVSTTIRASISNSVENQDDPDPAIVDATASEVTVISYTDAGPSFETPLQIRYQIVDGRMTEDRWKPSIVNGYAKFPGLNTTPYQTRTLGNVVVNTALEPLFRYYSATGAELIPGTTGLSLTQRAAAASVHFDVKVLANNSHEVVELQNNIGMPNTALAQDGS